jgi:alanyl-tRNA synthetase
VLHFEEGLEPALVRELADAIAEKCGGRAAVFSGTDEGGYSYCLATREGDLRAFGKEMNAALNGRGGGKPNFQQGRVTARKTEIETFFAK